MTTELHPTIEEDIKTATEAVAARRPVPRDVEVRLDARAAEFRERIFKQHGFLNSVSAIRNDREAGH